MGSSQSKDGNGLFIGNTGALLTTLWQTNLVYETLVGTHFASDRSTGDGMDRDLLIRAVQDRVVPLEYASEWEQAGLVRSTGENSWEFKFEALSQLKNYELQQLFAETKRRD